MGIIEKTILKKAGVENIKVTKEEFIKKLDEIFLSKITEESDYDEIKKIINPSAFKGIVSLSSKDENYVMKSRTELRRTIPIIRHWIYIQDLETLTCYEYKAAMWGGFKKMVYDEIEAYRSGKKK
ncbi:MAG: hypothetical protein IJ053_00370 [Lachnospiraceae bacterium]|nr:hypothetical protein [Lachnospiraceae bacterium]